MIVIEGWRKNRAHRQLGSGLWKPSCAPSSVLNNLLSLRRAWGTYATGDGFEEVRHDGRTDVLASKRSLGEPAPGRTRSGLDRIRIARGFDRSRRNRWHERRRQRHQ